MKLYFYGIECRNNEAGEREHFISRKEVEARETPKLYLSAQKSNDFPCSYTRLPREYVDIMEIYDGYLILTHPDDEAARAVWKRRYEHSADTFTRHAEEYKKQAEECRKIAAAL